MKKTALFVFAFALLVLTNPASAACRKALAIGVDVSASVDKHEYRLQLGGLAGALAHPNVAAILLSFPQAPVDLMVFEWGDTDYQRIILPWTKIDSPKTLTYVVNLLHRASLGQTDEQSGEDFHTQRMASDPSTAIGSAMLFGVGLLNDRPCWERTLDLSGDGVSNTGPDPKDVSLRLKDSGVTINALPVISGAGSISADGQYVAARLERYFRNEVIMGNAAFVKSAQGFKDFKEAMTQKLLRELASPTLSSLMPGP